MFHPTVLKGRNEHEIELPIRVLDLSVVLQPVQCRLVQIEDGVQIAGHLRGIGLAMEHPEGAPAPLRLLDLKIPHGKGEEIGRDRLRFPEDVPGPSSVQELLGYLRAIGYRHPLGRNLKRHAERCLQIRLIENRKRKMGPVGNEQRVEEIRISVEGLVAGLELDADFIVRVRRERGAVDGHVVEDRRPLGRLSVDMNASHTLARILEVDDHGALGVVA